MRLRRLPLLLMFLCLSAASIFAQSEPKPGTVASPTPTSTVSDTQAGDFAADELKTQQEMTAELRFLRKDNAEKAKEIVNLRGELAVAERITRIEVERGDFFKEAAQKGIKAGDSCGLIPEKYDRMVATYNAEVTRLTVENDKLRESRKWRTVISAVGGAGAGYYVGQQGCR